MPTKVKAAEIVIPGDQTFELDWQPAPKLRPRVTVCNGRPHGYTPEKTVDAEERLRWLLREAGARAYPAGVPLALGLTFCLTRPASLKESVREPVHRPDLDQYIKLAMDACTGLLWADDSQVITIIARKVYHERPGLLLEVCVDGEQTSG